jgi:hypothetical protein
MMADDMSYEYIWQTFNNEKKSAQLMPLPRGFYKSADTFIKGLGDNEYDERAKNIKSNAVKILTDLYDRRKQKILIYAAYGRSLPNQTPEAEVRLFEKITELMKTPLSQHTEHQINKEFLKSLKDMPEIILPSGKKIGPLTKNQEFDIEDKDDVNFLINSEICERI